MGYDMKVYATVILNTRQGGIGNGLTYAVPSNVFVSIGSLIKAPLRKRLIEGIVTDLHREKPEGDYDVKDIAKVLSDEPLLTKNQIETTRWIAEYYVCPLRQALGLWLPGGEWEKLLPEKEEFVHYTIQLNSLVTKKYGKKQAALLDYLQGKEWVRWEEVKEATGTDKGVLRRLMEQGLVEVKEEVATCFDTRRRVILTSPSPRAADEGVSKGGGATHHAI